jgi:acylphosphatase
MARRLLIRGRVQGVGYRQWLVREARRRGVTGWVRNRRDGSVEALVDGSPDGVAQIVALARVGPPAAAVAGVETSEAEGQFQDFTWLPTE